MSTPIEPTHTVPVPIWKALAKCSARQSPVPRPNLRVALYAHGGMAATDGHRLLGWRRLGDIAWTSDTEWAKPAATISRADAERVAKGLRKGDVVQVTVHDPSRVTIAAGGATYEIKGAPEVAFPPVHQVMRDAKVGDSKGSININGAYLSELVGLMAAAVGGRTARVFVSLGGELDPVVVDAELPDETGDLRGILMPLRP